MPTPSTYTLGGYSKLKLRAQPSTGPRRCSRSSRTDTAALVPPMAAATPTSSPHPRKLLLPASLALPRPLALVAARSALPRMMRTSPRKARSPAPEPAPRPLALRRRRSSTRSPVTSIVRSVAMTPALMGPRPRLRGQTATSVLPKFLPLLWDRETTHSLWLAP